MEIEAPEQAFTAFFREAEPRLRRALTAAVGAEAEPDAAAEALSYGWQHWDRIAAMDNPVGYLYRMEDERDGPVA